jgi:tRNA A-37 threonylcarbamoyl transferase component Bud32
MATAQLYWLLLVHEHWATFFIGIVSVVAEQDPGKGPSDGALSVSVKVGSFQGHDVGMPGAAHDETPPLEENANQRAGYPFAAGGRPSTLCAEKFMATCSSCGAEVSVASRFCAACGAPMGSDDVATLTSDNLATLELGAAKSPRSARPSSSSSSRPPSSAGFSLNEGRFLPGRLLLGRYRIIALLGKGGMGEVYRADDLTLGQPVALKFLPEEATRDESLLERFRNEVRIARRVSHPNVCRVYDVGEVDGHTFFTMEYVDGEDLASLLRRIGRLPHDKALDIARQLCAGLAAAHAKGVLHRDLKPANIMLDGRGQVVVTDFGLAGLNDQIHAGDIRSGTPAYMAPEQLAGKEVTAQSDIYALGLVLYEVFTGKRAFTAEALAELVRGGTSTPSRPTSVVKDLDPAVERVILRCLEPEPRSRPVSALSVAAALPGGDPLAAALAAGETPSPEMVAAAGETAGLSPRVAMLCLAAILIGLTAAFYLTVRYSALDRMGAEQSPEVLTQKAREILARLGYEGRPADSFFDFDYDSDFVSYAEKNDKPRPQWDQILKARPSVLQFDYRQSPRLIVASDFHDLLLTPGMVDQYDPAPIQSGMVRLQLDQQGRLTAFEAIPSEVANPPAAAVQPFDWKLLFRAAELDPAQFQTAQPIWNSLASPDTRAAWTGKWPGTERPLRIEAAAFQGKPVYFYLIGDWTQPPRMQRPEEAGKKAGGMILLCSLILMIVAAAWLARRNYRQGRGDREGAVRLAILVFGVLMVLWALRSHLVPGLGTFGLMILAMSTAFFLSGLIFILYLALEPYVRRYWPQALISWSRLLTGRVRDPLVGRDILFGVLLGVIWIVIFKVGSFVMMKMGASPPLFQTDFLLSTRRALGAWLSQVPSAILGTLQFFFLLMGLKAVFKRDWLAAIVFVAIFTTAKTLGSQYPVVDAITSVVVYSIAAVIVFRFGLVPLACAIFTVDLLANIPFTADFSAWYVGTSVFALLSVVALAGWGFYTSLGDEPLWKPDV